MKIEIKSRFDGSVLFALETESLKLCVEAAVKSKANLSGADLRDADLSGAYLSGANLRSANLRDAYLSGAYLSGANLRSANLRSANLRDAYLRDADLVDANLRDADLSGANLVALLGQPNGWNAFAWVKDNTLMVQVGCRSKTLAEGREYWANKDDRREVLAALDYAEKIADLCGWIK